MKTATKTRRKPAPKTARPARKAPRKRPAPAPAEKSFDLSGVWQPLGGGFGGLSTTYDSFGSEGVPGPAELISAFTDTVFSCSTMIASSLAEIGVQLVAETRAGQAAPPGPKMWKPIRHRSKAVELTEVHDHPALDLLFKNDTLTYADMISATSIYLDVIGRAFWLVTSDPIAGKPTRVDLLPGHLVTTERDDAGRVVGYQLGAKQHKDDAPTYTPDKVLAFRNYEYLDPMQEGVSPVRSVWQRIQLSHKELSSWETIVGQMAHPSVLLTPKDTDAPLSEEGTERFVKQYQARLARQGQGGPLFLNEAVDFTVLNFPPKDQAGLALQDNLKSSVCNAFKVPRTLLDAQEGNFAGSKTAERAYQLFCLRPRISYILERITARLVRPFDDRLFLQAEEFITKDEALELQRQTAAVASYAAGVVTKNETRAVLDLPPVADGDKFFTPPAPTVPGMDFGGTDPDQADDNDQSKSKGAGSGPPLKPLVQVLQKWFDKQREYVLSRTTSKGWASKSWIDLSQFSNEMANDLYPAVLTYFNASAKSFVRRYGLTDDVWSVVTPGIQSAARKASMQFAQSTNQTTSLAIDQARQKLRDELAAGIVAGDLYTELADRVTSIFETATDERAYLIASSEKTRAIGSAELVTAKASGVVSKKVWLADGRACPPCKALDGQERDLDEPFMVDPRAGAYSVCQHPPAHPQCFCGQTFVVAGDGGQPAPA